MVHAYPCSRQDWRSIQHSESLKGFTRHQSAEEKQSIVYIEADYLSNELPSGFDIVTLIYTDYSVLSPDQRACLLGRKRRMLNPGGRLIMDVAGMGSLAQKEECTVIENKLMYGFWAEGDYVGIQRSFVYLDEHLSMDRYVIVEPSETWEIYNWFQYFQQMNCRRN